MWVSACASVVPQQAAPRDLLLEAARECETGFSGVRTTGIDRFGQVEFQYRSADDRDRFIACFQEHAHAKIKAAISSGRVSAPPSDATRTSVPVDVAESFILVSVMINELQHHTLLLDTGASRTILKPAVLDGLGIVVPTDAPRWPTRLADGRVVMLGWHADKVDGILVERASPPNYYLTWPLYVGKSWEYTYTWEGIPARQTDQRTRRCTVEAVESVTVPAGTFETFRVSCANPRGRVAFSYWFSDVVKMIVKEQNFLEYGVRTRELTGFRLD